MRVGHEEEKIHALQIRQKQEKMVKEVMSHTSEAITATTIKNIIN